MWPFDKFELGGQKVQALIEKTNEVVGNLSKDISQLQSTTNVLDLKVSNVHEVTDQLCAALNKALDALLSVQELSDAIKIQRDLLLKKGLLKSEEISLAYTVLRKLRNGEGEDPLLPTIPSCPSIGR